MQKSLTKQKCVPCEGGVSPVKGAVMRQYMKQLDGWSAVDEHHLYKLYRFPNFVKALRFVNKIGAIAEKEGHHPNIAFTWGKVEVTLWTHAIGGLSMNDFILAAKIDKIRN